MMIAKRVLLVAALVFSAGAAIEASPILFLVRHAERATTGGNDPELSAAGQQRAEALARILKDSEITAIFTTEFKRTQETAAPTAKATQIIPTIVPAKGYSAGRALAKEESPDERAVWQLEQSYWKYVQVGELESYLKLWHPKFCRLAQLEREAEKKRSHCGLDR